MRKHLNSSENFDPPSPRPPGRGIYSGSSAVALAKADGRASVGSAASDAWERLRRPVRSPRALRPGELHKSQGQTLIETLVAAFILTMGVSAAVGLAIYAFGSSSNITKQIVATGLAREGVEVVKNMRDTNWLKLANPDIDCYNYATGGGDQKCYKKWLTPPGSPGNGNDKKGYDINPSNPLGTSYVLLYDFTSGRKFWNLKEENSKFGLDLNTQISDVNFAGFYVPNTSKVNGNSGFHRKITIKANSAAPFGQNIGPELQVVSQVWWADRKCPNTSDWPGLGKCSVEIQSFLTNWKNY